MGWTWHRESHFLINMYPQLANNQSLLERWPALRIAAATLTGSDLGGGGRGSAPQPSATKESPGAAGEPPKSK